MQQRSLQFIALWFLNSVRPVPARVFSVLLIKGRLDSLLFRCLKYIVLVVLWCSFHAACAR